MLVLSVSCALSQSVHFGQRIPPVSQSWPTYNGDYSGRRFSALSQINETNVHSLRLAWAFQTHAEPLKSTPLEVNGVLYFSVSNRVWAVDARTGEQIWTFHRSAPGERDQRGVGFYRNRLYFGTTDAHLLCLDANSGKVLWNRKVASEKAGYYVDVAPLIVHGKVIVGTSGDVTNIPAFIEALNWKTGAPVWKRSVLPSPGSSAAHTWPNYKAMEHGGGSPWITGTYDPELNLLYWGTGNPHPMIDGRGRQGANLYTCSILALNPDTGALVWWYQTTPHDTHDWDAVETPVLFDANFDGKRRELLAQANRNDYFFVLDRKTGMHLLTAPYVPTNWASGLNSEGQPIQNPDKSTSASGTLIHSADDGSTNWWPPSFDPQTGLFYVNATEGYSFWYLALDSKGKPIGYSGGGRYSLIKNWITEAIDYQTGKIRWKRESGQGSGTPGILTTAGHVLFTGDVSGNLLALDPENGLVLWHTRPGGNLSNGPITYEVDGRQYVVMGVDSVLYAWSLSGS